MVALNTQASGGGRAPGPGPTPTEEYRVGDPVRERVGYEIVASTNGGIVVTPVPPRSGVIAGVIREETLHGSTVSYRVIDARSSFVADPANLIRIEDERAAPAVQSPPVSPIVWLDRGGVQLSADGRFRIEVGNDGLFCATDGWTGERVSGLAIRLSAEQWCRVRLVGHIFEWRLTDRCWVGETPRGKFRVYETTGGRFFGVDTRFESGSDETPHGLRQSPWFDSLEEAADWCRIRASCVIEGDPAGNAVSLRYER